MNKIERTKLLTIYSSLMAMGRIQGSGKLAEFVSVNLTILDKTIEEHREYKKTHFTEPKGRFKEYLNKEKMLVAKYELKQEGERKYYDVNIKPEFLLIYEKKLNKLRKKYKTEYELTRTEEKNYTTYMSELVEVELKTISGNNIPENVTGLMRFPIEFLIV